MFEKPSLSTALYEDHFRHLQETNTTSEDEKPKFKLLTDEKALENANFEHSLDLRNSVLFEFYKSLLDQTFLSKAVKQIGGIDSKKDTYFEGDWTVQEQDAKDPDGLLYNLLGNKSPVLQNSHYQAFKPFEDVKLSGKMTMTLQETSLKEDQEEFYEIFAELDNIFFDAYLHNSEIKSNFTNE
jgi:hypothetical protein